MKKIFSVVAFIAMLCIVVSCDKDAYLGFDDEDADAYKCWEISYCDNDNVEFIEYKWASKTEIESYVASMHTEDNLPDIQYTPVSKYKNIDDCQNANSYYKDKPVCWKITCNGNINGEVTKYMLYMWASRAGIETHVELLEKLGYTDIVCEKATKYKTVIDCSAKNVDSN